MSEKNESKKKIMVIIGDGMSDLPIDSLGGRTPIEAAETPNMDAAAREGILGLTHNVPDGMPPGSDVAIMSIMGYDPKVCHTGRGPIEAASIGVEIKPGQTAFRCNIINIDGDILADYSSGHIETAEAGELIDALQAELGGAGVEFHRGVSYRHLLLIDGDFSGVRTHPPHDHLNARWSDWLPSGPGAERLLDIIAKSQAVLADHSVNRRRVSQGRVPANSAWPWSGGKAPDMPRYSEKYGLSGAAISAVDLVQGLGVLAGLNVIKVPGATGLVDTNYDGKVAAALDAIEKYDIVILHLEGPDEAANVGDRELKIEGIRRLDSLVVGPLAERMRKFDDYALLVLPDHPTPIKVRTHTADPVPFVALATRLPFNAPRAAAFSEREAAATGLVISAGHTLLGLLSGKLFYSPMRR